MRRTNRFLNHMQIVMLGALILLTSMSTPLLARKVELWGSLLCQSEGDSLRTDALGHQNLLVLATATSRPVLSGEAGFFSIPLEGVPRDPQLHIRVFRASPGSAQDVELVGSFSPYLEESRWRHFGDRWLYNLGEFDLHKSCDSLTTDLEATLAWKATRDLAYQASTSGKKPTARAGVLAALGASLATLALRSPVLAAPPPSECDSVAIEEVEVISAHEQGLSPGEYTSYAREGTSASLGRVTTSRRSPEELALWNPSALVFSPEGGLSVVGNTPKDFRASLRVPVTLGPLRFLSLGAMLLQADRSTFLRLENDSTLVDTLEHEEAAIVATAGLRLNERFALSLGCRYVSQNAQMATGVRHITRLCEGVDGTTTTELILMDHHKDVFDVDAGFTWEAGDRIRLGGSLYHALGSESLEAEADSRSPREATLGALFTYERLEAGAEVSIANERGAVASGLHYRFSKHLALDAAGGSRYESLQAGLDVFVSALIVKARIARDKFEDLRGGVTLDFRF